MIPNIGSATGTANMAAANTVLPAANNGGGSNTSSRSSGTGPAPRGASGTDSMGAPHRQAGELDRMASGNEDQEMQMIRLLIQLLQMMIEMMESGSGESSGAIAPNGGGSPINEEVGGGHDDHDHSGDGVNGDIPPPTENVQTFELGGKQITVGGDGTASAQEVEQAAATMQRMYETSPSFRSTVDDNPNQELSVTVGKRSDNTSWGSTNGSVFLNINNFAPTSNDTMEGILGHEVAHTKGIGHGPEMDALQEAIAREAN